MKIAICQNTSMWNHPDSFSTNEYIERCKERSGEGVEFEIIDPYATDFIEKIKEFDGVMWNFQNYLWADTLEAKNILHAVERMGKVVYPDHSTAWHFDDKVAEMYALQSVGAPIPESHIFYSKETALEYFKSCSYPVVTKLRCGSGSNNVKLLRSYSQAKKYTRKMFGRGFSPAPSLLFKAKSKAGSAHDWKTFKARLKKLPVFLYTRRHAKMMPREHGYVYLQEFIPDNDFDYRVHVCNGISWACMRKVRKGDFRASGSSDLIYDSSSVPEHLIEKAFAVAEALKLQCVAFDFIHDKRDDIFKILEMSYSFGFDKEDGENGYWTRDMKFHPDFFNPFKKMADIVIDKVKKNNTTDYYESQTRTR